MIIQNQQKNIISKTKGFTLIELMVATSLFIVIMLSALSALFMLLDESKNSRALRFAMDNVNFAMDSMTRSIRMGTNYYCGTFYTTDLISTNDCPSGDTLISFVPQPKGTIQAISRIGFGISAPRSDGTNSLERCEQNNGTTSCVSIVSDNVDVQRIKFFVKLVDANTGNKVQPSVYIIMKGTVMVKGVPTSFAVQTMASQRNF